MSGFFDWLFIPSTQQTPAEAQANYSRLQNELAAQDSARLAAGTISPTVYAQNQKLAQAAPLEDPGAAATDAFYSGLNPFSSADPNGTGAGVGTVLKDLFILGVIGAGIWAFLKFGGTGFLKTLTKKSKWYVAGIAGAAVLLLWFIYSRFKHTATDTQQVVTGVSSSFASLI
jgi:hypothetical protein